MYRLRFIYGGGAESIGRVKGELVLTGNGFFSSHEAQLRIAWNGERMVYAGN
jgi:hypothetical protein